MRCRGCKYDLTGLDCDASFPEPRCPECGRSFDQTDRVTYWSFHDDEGIFAARLLIASIGVLALVLFVWMMIMLGWIPVLLQAYSNALLAGIAIASLVVELALAIISLRCISRARTAAAKHRFCASAIVAVLYGAWFWFLAS